VPAGGEWVRCIVAVMVLARASVDARPAAAGALRDAAADTTERSATVTAAEAGSASDRGAEPPSEIRLIPTRAYYHVLGAVAVGQGLRFNNPYRLQTQLGSTGESLSLSAPYLDWSLGVTSGDPNGLQHGGALHYSEALAGISQSVLTPSYLVVLCATARWLGRGRVGIPVVLRPDTAGGVEAALGFGWHVTAGFGIAGEVIGSLFYGAATHDTAVTKIPMLSFQLGAFADYEVLP